ncbi:hypothetical protein P5673_023722 [Acropora cervicornis]|uniref:Reverse transcriptase n=1 Tax=Acropora cervicornis TaxID=6130 RepID=A0AAD9Q4Z9_ACRCE|nr:hypothetical protein P5673_033242 [Acropora cervicornis]KAK2554758.1 hypothetical protein P5673_023722 [Acropora cervicornis]
MAIISSSRELSSQEAGIVVQILESLGFIINKEKSVLFPSQKIVFLGYVIDSVARTVSLPEEKLNKWDELLTLPQEDFLHPLKDVMRLAAWYVSGITYRSEEFLQGQPAMCSSHGVQGQKSSTQRLGNVFVAGVIGNREILFKQI